MEYQFDPKLEPPDSPISQDRLTPEYNLKPYGMGWMNHGDASNSQSFDENYDYAKESIRRLCLVCCDIASGLHYGVASCEACKAFFKRTIQGNIEYSCPASGCCEITRYRRKACQACRYQKCLDMGMLKEGVRRDRVRGGRQKYKKINDLPYPVVIRAEKPPNLKRLSSYGDIKVKPIMKKACKPVGSKLVHTLKSIEPEKVYARPDKYSGDDLETKFKAIISDLIDRELMAIVGWVKQVPDFRSLRLGDQMSLLRSNWLDIVCLNIIYRSLPYDGDIVYADDLKLSEEDACLFGAKNKSDDVMRRLIRILSEMKLSYEEYLLLKAVILFNTDEKLDDTRLVKQQRDNVCEGLLEYEGLQKDSKLFHRAFDLLTLLPLITHASYETRDFFLSVAEDSSITLPKLLGEMLEYASNK